VAGTGWRRVDIGEVILSIRSILNGALAFGLSLIQALPVTGRATPLPIGYLSWCVECISN
jgi:hypothetical protein